MQPFLKYTVFNDMANTSYIPVKKDEASYNICCYDI